MEERAIHILLTRSGTWFSRLIHLATQDDYTHASIGLARWTLLQLCQKIRTLCPPRRTGGGAGHRPPAGSTLLPL